MGKKVFDSKGFLLILCLVFLDFITKFFVSKYNIHFGLINYTLNSGIIFGFLKGYNLIFIFINLLVVLLLGYFIFFRKTNNGLNRGFRFGFSLVLAGAIGNLIDRIIYSNVIDFIDLKYWYVFNLADAFIVVGVGLILIEMIKNRK